MTVLANMNAQQQAELLAGFDLSLVNAEVSRISGLRDKLRIGSGATFVAAAADAPALVKRGADWVSSGNDDYPALQQIINDMASAGTQRDGANHDITGGIKGSMVLSDGQFNIGTRLSVPAGSIFSMHGQGPSSWIPIDAVPLPDTPMGGTCIYSTDPTGRIFACGQSTFGTPATGLSMGDLDFRIKNPDTLQVGPAVAIPGVKTGYLENFNVLCQLVGAPTRNVRGGFNWGAGGASSAKYIAKVNVYNFNEYGILLNTTHLTALTLSAGNINGNAFATAFKIAPQDDCYYANLQAFSAKYGLQVTNSNPLQLAIEQFHCEACDEVALVDSIYPVFIRTLNMDAGVPWSGDITTKVLVDQIVKKNNASKRAQFYGTVTVPAGQTSASIAHNLLVAPKRKLSTALGNPGTNHWMTSDATNLTVNLAAAQPGDVAFDVYGRI